MRISDWSSDVCSSDLSPYSAPTERRFGNQPLALTPAVEAIEAGDCPVPACRADPLGGVAAPPRAVIGGHIVAGRVPYRRAAGIEEAKPHRNVIGVGAQRMARADPRERQVDKEERKSTRLNSNN